VEDTDEIPHSIAGLTMLSECCSDTGRIWCRSMDVGVGIYSHRHMSELVLKSRLCKVGRSAAQPHFALLSAYI
jgi:hypothetical protein